MPVTLEPPPPPAGRRHTVADLLAMADDGIERWIVNGQIEEVGVTQRNKHHARIECRVGGLIDAWVATQPAPRGAVYSGEVGVILRKDPELSVGIDVAYLTAEQVAANDTDDDTTLLVGPPALAVEILSPNDTQKDTVRKLKWYREVGVAMVWVIDPDLKTVAVHRPGQKPVVHNEDADLDGDTVLPGFRVSVARLFAH
jgi:Uma2 family endonuclease